MIARNPECFLDRVVDSDTIILWIEATPDVRVRYRVRLALIEGGELGTEEGARGTLVLNEALAEFLLRRTFYIGSLLTRDQHGRLVGDVADETGRRLTHILHGLGHHWRREKNGLQVRI